MKKEITKVYKVRTGPAGSSGIAGSVEVRGSGVVSASGPEIMAPHVWARVHYATIYGGIEAGKVAEIAEPGRITIWVERVE